MIYHQTAAVCVCSVLARGRRARRGELGVGGVTDVKQAKTISHNVTRTPDCICPCVHDR